MRAIAHDSKLMPHECAVRLVQMGATNRQIVDLLCIMDAPAIIAELEDIRGTGR